MLLIPGTLWFQYLAVLLPFAAMAWPRAEPPVRAALVTSAALVGIAPYLAEQPLLAHAGATVLLVAAAWVLWPRRISRESLVEGTRHRLA
jgi:hypothetical protein